MHIDPSTLDLKERVIHIGRVAKTVKVGVIFVLSRWLLLVMRTAT